MNPRKFFLSFLMGGLAMLILAGLWHMGFMADFYQAHTSPGAYEKPVLRFIVLGYAILGVLMAYIYPKGYSGGSVAKEGIKFGILMGLLWVLPHGVVLHATYPSSGLLLVVDALWHVVEQGVGGVVIASIYGSTTT